MKVFRELRINGKPNQLTKLVDQITASLTSDWLRAHEKESSLTNQVRSKLYCFECHATSGRPGAALWLASLRPEELYVSNVVPTEIGSLKYDQYNLIVEEFHRDFVLPAAHNLSVSVHLDDADVGIDKWLDKATVDILTSFSRTANRSTGASHPSDKRLWHEFLISTHKTDSDLDSGTLSRWLYEVEGWPDSMASELAIDYEKARSLLEDYDSNA